MSPTVRALLALTLLLNFSLSHAMDLVPVAPDNGATVECSSVNDDDFSFSGDNDLFPLSFISPFVVDLPCVSSLAVDSKPSAYLHTFSSSVVPRAPPAL